MDAVKTKGLTRKLCRYCGKEIKKGEKVYRFGSNSGHRRIAHKACFESRLI